MLTTVFSNVSAHFPYPQFYLYHTYCQDFFSILLFIACSFGYESIDLSIISLIIVHVNLIILGLMIGFSFSYVHAIFTRFHPFLQQVILVEIST